MYWHSSCRVEATGGDRWVSLIFGTPEHGPHTKPTEGKVLVARDDPEDNDEHPQL